MSTWAKTFKSRDNKFFTEISLRFKEFFGQKRMKTKNSIALNDEAVNSSLLHFTDVLISLQRERKKLLSVDIQLKTTQ